jgi:hypothetical protein
MLTTFMAVKRCGCRRVDEGGGGCVPIVEQEVRHLTVDYAITDTCACHVTLIDSDHKYVSILLTQENMIAGRLSWGNRS